MIETQEHTPLTDAGGLRRTLGLVETAAISLAMMAPTAAMALNAGLAASFAGPNVWLAFALAFVTIGCVAFGFVTFARVYASPASVGEFNAKGLGPLAGRLSAWALLLVYVLFSAGSIAEFGAFAASSLAYERVYIPWLPLGLGCLLIVAYVGTRPARTSSRTTLIVEGVSVAAVIALSLEIVARDGAHGLSISAIPLSASGLTGLGLATVFALLSFAGFEGAAVLGAESVAPKQTIPRALILSVASSGVLYVFVAYAQSAGFGFDARGVAAFAASPSPLGDLALRYANVTMAVLVTAGAAISAFAAALAAATGAARLLYSFARDGRLPGSLARIDRKSGTPAVAYRVVLGLATTIILGFARTSGTDAFAACGTIAVLALVLVYGAVQISALRLFFGRWNAVERVVPILALVSLAATFVANVVPVPHGAAAPYPYIVVLWLVAGVAVLRQGKPA